MPFDRLLIRRPRSLDPGVGQFPIETEFGVLVRALVILSCLPSTYANSSNALFVHRDRHVMDPSLSCAVAEKHVQTRGRGSTYAGMKMRRLQAWLAIGVTSLTQNPRVKNKYHFPQIQQNYHGLGSAVRCWLVAQLVINRLICRSIPAIIQGSHLPLSITLLADVTWVLR